MSERRQQRSFEHARRSDRSVEYRLTDARLLSTGLRHLCTRAEHVRMTVPGSHVLVQAIMSAIDDYVSKQWAPRPGGTAFRALKFPPDAGRLFLAVPELTRSADLKLNQ
jgi:hypothetical protein